MKRTGSWLLLVAVANVAHAAAALPAVASINLCTDQLVLSIAAPEQVVSVSWLSADEHESMLAAAAQRYPLNYGTAEEILLLDPDIVVGGQYTSTFTRSTLSDLGFEVVSIAPASSLDDIETNLRRVGAALQREAAAEAAIAGMRARADRIARQRGERRVPAIVIRPGGFTVGAHSLADELMALGGLENIAATGGLDVWGSLSLESLVVARPDLVIFTGYRTAQPSVANSIFSHPVIESVLRRTQSITVPAPLWSCGLPESLVSAELILESLPVTGR